MSKMNDGGAAFPLNVRKYNAETGRYINSDGMTLRDWFAGQALAGMMACSYNVERGDEPTDEDVHVWPATQDRCGEDEEIAGESYRMADAMLAAREAT